MTSFLNRLRLNFTLLLFVCVAALFAGCSKDDSEPGLPPSGQTGEPMLILSSSAPYIFSDTLTEAGKNVATKVIASSGSPSATLKRYLITVQYQSGQVAIVLDSVLNTASLEHTFTYTTQHQAGKEKWTFEVTDSQGKTASRYITITTEDTTPIPPIPAITINLTEDATFTGTDKSVEAGSGIQSKITASSNIAGQPLKRFTVTVSYDGSVPVTVSDTLISQQDLVFTYAYQTRQVAGTEMVTFIVTDNNRTASKSITLTVTDPFQGIVVRSFSNIVIGAQNNSVQGSCLDATSGQVYNFQSAPANSEEIDVIYLYQNSYEANLRSPSDNFVFGNGASLQALGVATWAVRNETKFKWVSTDPAAAITIFTNATTPQSLEQAFYFNSTSEMYMAFGLQTDHVVAFRTTNGKFGLIWVKEVIPGNTGHIIADIKMQD